MIRTVAPFFIVTEIKIAPSFRLLGLAIKSIYRSPSFTPCSPLLCFLVSVPFEAVQIVSC
jgi:hypothetical protein